MLTLCLSALDGQSSRISLRLADLEYRPLALSVWLLSLGYRPLRRLVYRSFSHKCGSFRANGTGLFARSVSPRRLGLSLRRCRCVQTVKEGLAKRGAENTIPKCAVSVFVETLEFASTGKTSISHLYTVPHDSYQRKFYLGTYQNARHEPQCVCVCSSH